MSLRNKIAVLLRKDLKLWQQFNVTAFLSSAVASRNVDSIGSDLIEASKLIYPRMFRWPVIVFEATEEQLRESYQNAIEENLFAGIFTEELFATKIEKENHIVMSRRQSDAHTYAGVVVKGAQRSLSRLLKGIPLVS